jgi:ABC-type branched-subunit amino acid transport system ATPase component/ABC-type branched-subunit amino acid transport system permease subunit
MTLLPGYYAVLLGTVASTALAGVGLNVLVGLAGEVSLGQVGFVAIGAYATAILSGAGVSFWAALALAGVLAATVGALLALPALRGTGPYLAMVTIAFGFIVENASVEWERLTGGAGGIGNIAPPRLLGHLFTPTDTALLSVAACAIAVAGFGWLRRAPLGLILRASADAPAAARAVGADPLPARIAAFVLAALAAGVAGGLMAVTTGYIAPSSFPFSQSILLLLAVVVGGAGTTFGPVIGAALMGLLPELLAGLEEYRLMIFGVVLLAVLRLAPHGIAGWLARGVRSRTAPEGDAARGLALLRAHGGAPLLAEGLSVAFGGVRALADVGFSAEPGAVTAIIGPNGAGKTTLLNVLSGFQRADAGGFAVGPRALTATPAHRLARGALARSFQTSRLFESLSVLDNVHVALLAGGWRARADAATARGLLALVGYAGPPSRTAGALAHVDRRLVEIARALATRPAVLLLDEPAAGLDRADADRLGRVLRRIAEAGTAVVLVEHDMALVMAVSDHVVVLDAGRRIAEGPPEAVRQDKAVRAAYLGGGTALPARRSRRIETPPLLAARGLAGGYGALRVLRGADIAVRAGEMLALLGRNGAGKSTLMRALSGLLRPVDGTVTLGETPLARLPAHRVARAGLVLVPEGRQVFPLLTVRQNMALGATRTGAAPGPDAMEAMLRRFPRLRPLLDRAAGLLSGGEQQMLALARGLLAQPEVLLLDEPSLGLAPAVAEELFATLSALRDEGMTLLLVDQMADVALALADRCAVLQDGCVLDLGTAEQARESGALEASYLGAAEARA